MNYKTESGSDMLAYMSGDMLAHKLAGGSEYTTNFESGRILDCTMGDLLD